MPIVTIVASVGLVAAVTVLLATLWIGIRRREADVAVNAVASIGAVGVPFVVDHVVIGGAASIGPVLPLSLAVAGALHMFGMLGWYDSVWWWDHVTHTVSAALLAAVIYAWVVVAGPDTLPGIAGRATGASTLVITTAAGIAWELVEHAARHLSDRVGVERVLKHYGRFDTPLDLLFDVVGAAIVVGFDGRIFVPLFEPIPGTTETLLVGSLVALAVVSVASAAIVAYGRYAW